MSVIVLAFSSVASAANLSPKTVNTIIAKLSIMMQKDPQKFEMTVKRFYDAMDTLPEKKLQVFVPLIEKVNALVDQYNAKTVEEKKDASVITLKDLETFKKTLFFKGSSNASLSIIEFSDFECPFCKRHNTAGTIASLLKTYDGKVNYAYAHFPLGFHPLAQKAAEAFECAVSLGANAYDVETNFYATSSPTRANLEKVATDMKLDLTTFKTCLDTDVMAQKIKDHMNIATTFGVRGTPANVVVNNTTGKFIIVS
ncbi:MAG: hypothetical protein RL023_324 [Candidatus Parcubacteria bacterium]